MSRICRLACAVTTLTITASAAMALAGSPSGHRQHGVHVHGTAQLNLALEGRRLHLELRSPAANILGFEHDPVSDTDHATLDSAIAFLRQGDRLFGFPPGAGCRLHEAAVESPLIEDDPAERHHHASTHDPDPATEPHRRRDATHADIAAAYYFECADPDGLTRIDVGLLQAFPAMQRLQVQFVTGDTQGSADLSRSKPVLNF